MIDRLAPLGRVAASLSGAERDRLAPMQKLKLVHPVSHGLWAREERDYRYLETQDFSPDIAGRLSGMPNRRQGAAA
jgi:hypothetical protein